MRSIILIAFVCLLSACGGEGQPMDSSVPNQCIRAQLFEQCLANLPAGPEVTHYNDWDEVVNSCESRAYYESIRLKSQVPMACRAD